MHRAGQDSWAWTCCEEDLHQVEATDGEMTEFSAGSREQALLFMGVENWKPGTYLLTVGDFRYGFEREEVN